MSTKAFTALVIVAWLTTVVALVILITTVTHAAEMSTCRVYATRGSSVALRQLLGLDFVDVATGKFLYRKAYSFCVNADEVPEISFTPEEQVAVHGMPLPPMKPEGAVPAAGEDEQVRGDPPPVPAKPAKKARRAVSTTSGDQPLCLKHGRRTVYNGRHWRCVQ